MKFKIFSQQEEASSAVADSIAQAITVNPSIRLGLPTGSTPLGVYQQLIKKSQNGLSFSKVVTFNLDEYVGLPGSHPQSYRYFMESNFFKHIDLPTWNRHLLDGVARYPELECEAYELKIRAQGGINLWFLGIGGNGHIAFNEPGSPVNSRTRIVSLTQETIEANSDGRFFSNPDEVPRCALSVGIGAIREADQIIILALGEKKAQAVANAIQGSFDPSCPASLLQDHPNVTYYLDEHAASKLTK